MGFLVVAGGSSSDIDREVKEVGEEVKRLGIIKIDNVGEVEAPVASITRLRRRGRRQCLRGDKDGLGLVQLGLGLS